MKKIVMACLIVSMSIPVATSASAQDWSSEDGRSGTIVLAQAGPGFWNGFHGERGPRDGFRRGPDGWWYPLAAFAAGTIVGGAMADGDRAPPPPPPPPGYEPPPRRQFRHALPPEHFAWCAKRYRSYEASDNSYVPRSGLRAQCMSPYS